MSPHHQPENSAPSPSLREALREASADVHHRLEARLPLTSDNLTRTAYRQLLEAFYGFYRPLEESLDADAAAIAGLGWPRRRKASLLEEDLKTLGMDAAAIAAVPTCPSLPRLDHRAATLGCLYVLEGSTLGGLITGRAIGKRFGFTPEEGARFLLPYGQDTGPMWRSFLEILGEADAESPEFHARACSAAVETFSALEGWFEERRVLL
jgi:heme oxygenase